MSEMSQIHVKAFAIYLSIMIVIAAVVSYFSHIPFWMALVAGIVLMFVMSFLPEYSES